MNKLHSKVYSLFSPKHFCPHECPVTSFFTLKCVVHATFLFVKGTFTSKRCLSFIHILYLRATLCPSTLVHCEKDANKIIFISDFRPPVEVKIATLQLANIIIPQLRCLLLRKLQFIQLNVNLICQRFNCLCRQSKGHRSKSGGEEKKCTWANWVFR